MWCAALRCETAPLRAKTASSASTAPKAPRSLWCVPMKVSSTTTVIRRLPAAIRTSARKFARLVLRTMTAATTHPVSPAALARTLPVDSPSPRLGVSSAPQVRRILTPTPPRLARPAHRVVTQRVGTLTTASDVSWGDLRLRPEEPAWPLASHASLGSSPASHHRRVSSAPPAWQTKTRMRRHHAHLVVLGRTPGVARPPATNVWLAKSTAMKMQPHHARHA